MNILASIILGLSLVFLMYSCGSTLMIPVVQYSFTTDQCVSVINSNMNDKYDCTNLPAKHYASWVR